jgi:ubiquinone/menaquinone biosynthesis C-methylase UbiE
LRRLLESPERLLGPFVSPGMTVVEPGCGMGYFTIPLARMVGPTGQVLAVDLQPRMIDGLAKRARRAGMADRVHPVICTTDSLGLDRWAGRADLAVVVHMLHEVPDPERLLADLFSALRPGGRLVILEPKGHVSASAFAESVRRAEVLGFKPTGEPVGGRGPGAVLRKEAEAFPSHP